MKLKRRGKIVLISILSILILLSSIAGIFLYGAFQRTTSSQVVNNDSRDEKWVTDLQFVKSELPKKHKNLFFSMTEADFNKEMDLLINNVKNYDDLKIKGELAKTINSVNDSHTFVDIRGTLAFPFNFFEYEEGIYLNNTSLEYKDFWGKKLTAINGYTIDQLRGMLDPYISHDNLSIERNKFCDSLKYVETMKMAGILKNDEATFTFEDGTKTDVIVKALNGEGNVQITALTDMPEYITRFPLSRQNARKEYWFDYNDSNSTVYVKYNSCSNTQGYPFSSFTKDVFELADSKNAKTLIIDLRDNGGGNSAIFNPFLSEITKHANINKKENLFVIIGRKTFSSAVLNAMDLKNKTNATLIGEPSGGRPNHFGEVKMLNLSNVNVNIYYSSNYFKTTNEDTDAIYPDVNIQTKASSFFSGKDDCLEYVFKLESSK